MADQKIENLLNLAMDATQEERWKSLDLDVGYEENTKLWELIVKYSGDIEGLTGQNVRVEPLLGGFAIVTLPENELESFALKEQVEFIEKPKRLYFALDSAKRASCINSVQWDLLGGSDTQGNLQLSGRGVLTGIVDSGIDYRHPDFQKENGETRILGLWDQTPEDGIAFYSESDINQALRLPLEEGYRRVPERDLSGHGTAVAGILAGNGRSSNGQYRGIAYESDLLVVKLGIPKTDMFPRTTELMKGVDILVREAQRLERPLALNISFGNNYGSHEPCN